MQVPLDELVFYIAYMFKQEAGRAPSLLEIWCVLEELAEHFPEVREELRKICRDWSQTTRVLSACRICLFSPSACIIRPGRRIRNSASGNLLQGSRCRSKSPVSAA